MPDILAIVSKAIFERDAIANGQLIGVGDVWPVDRYVSAHRSFQPLREGGRIFLVTVRPPDEQLWLVGVIDSPLFEGNAWVGRGANVHPITNITSLRRSLTFSSGRGLSQDPGTLGMSLQTPRVLTDESAAAILTLVGGARPPPRAGLAGSMMTQTASQSFALSSEGLPPLLSGDALRDIEDPDARKARVDILTSTVADYVVLFDKMQETFGLRLPESFAYGIGFLKALDPDERRDVEACIGKLAGIARWFEDGEVGTPPGGDERLRDRLLTDPPELVTILVNDTTNERWGLWYDDSDELPTGVAERRLVSDEPGFETRVDHATLAEAIRGRISTNVRAAVADLAAPPSAEPESTNAAQARRWRVISHWLTEVLHLQARCEKSPIPIPTKGWILGERMSPYLENVPDLPIDLVGYSAKDARREAYVAGAAIVNDWIERARDELRDGSPARALVIGRELNAFQGHEAARPWRYAASELLIRAYLAVGRRPFADIVRVTYQHDDPAAPLYVPPPPHPIVLAAEIGGAGDSDAILHALSDGDVAPTAEDLEAALSAPSLTPSALDALVEHARAAGDDGILALDTALWRRLQMFFRSRKPKDASHHKKLVLRLIESGSVNARAFARVLRGGDAQLIKLAASRVDLSTTTTLASSTHEGESSAGATPLHLAARAANPEIVRLLLDRGADAKAKNAGGRMAFDSAREAQIENPNDPRATEVLNMLQLAGGGMAKPPLPVSDEVEYEEGDEVHHGKLGDGVVESVTGEGEEAKLKIRFANETRTLLAKFVTKK